MGNSLRCCLACILPCGALDFIRIVHANGRVEEYGRPVSAKEILDANPDHVIRRPCAQSVPRRRAAVVPPDAELKRGHIYFLIPAPPLPEARRKIRRRRGGNVASTKARARDHDARSRRKGDRAAATWRPHLECIAEDWS